MLIVYWSVCVRHGVCVCVCMCVWVGVGVSVRTCVYLIDKRVINYVASYHIAGNFRGVQIFTVFAD